VHGNNYKGKCAILESNTINMSFGFSWGIRVCSIYPSPSSLSVFSVNSHYLKEGEVFLDLFGGTIIHTYNAFWKEAHAALIEQKKQ